jgi:hypothetical protein
MINDYTEKQIQPKISTKEAICQLVHGTGIFESQRGQLKYFYILNTIEDGLPSIRALSVNPDDLDKLSGLTFIDYAKNTKIPVPRFQDEAYVDYTEKQIQPKISTKEAICQLVHVVNHDRDYAWVWQCSLAMAILDEGGSHELSNRAAARFLQQIFAVDITKFAEFKDFEEQWKKDASKKYYEDIDIDIDDGC